LELESTVDHEKARRKVECDLDCVTGNHHRGINHECGVGRFDIQFDLGKDQ
jgi:hypothetical protein